MKGQAGELPNNVSPGPGPKGEKGSKGFPGARGFPGFPGDPDSMPDSILRSSRKGEKGELFKELFFLNHPSFS